jgi:hydroxymethylpyrimidine/phosphomethylpyrimidine kinase
MFYGCPMVFNESGRTQEYRPKIHMEHGCTISTVIAVGLAKGKTTLNAIDEAIAFTHQLVEVSAQSRLVAHNGPLLHFKMNK